MDYVIKADMNAEVLAGELFKTASQHPDKFTVTPDSDVAGHLRSGSFTIIPANDVGIDGLSGKTYAGPDSQFELSIDVTAICWPEDTEAVKTKALFSIFQPLVDLYNQTRKSEARIELKS